MHDERIDGANLEEPVDSVSTALSEVRLWLTLEFALSI